MRSARMRLRTGMWTLIAATVVVSSCAEDDVPILEANTPAENNATTTHSRANSNQALQIANIFSSTRGFAEESARNKAAGNGKNGYYAINGNT